MRVDIWSDIVCPWCYLGKRRFERALDAFEERAEVQVVHRSFQLDPTRPKGQTQNRREMLMSKYHLAAAQVEAMDARMEQTAAADGLEYHLRQDGVTGNTYDAHSLLHLAAARGQQEASLDSFYRA
jgi:predicted DsbA family dithiol-disulfide isomerase